jgi:hypothetical protein
LFQQFDGAIYALRLGRIRERGGYEKNQSDAGRERDELGVRVPHGPPPIQDIEPPGQALKLYLR